MLSVFSFGCGVQSVACEVLAAQGELDYRNFAFCNAGADSENPETLDYYHQYALPYALSHGLNMFELRYIRRDGNEDTIFKRLTRPGSRSIGIPVRMSNGAPSVLSLFPKVQKVRCPGGLDYCCCRWFLC